jgi:hypothetical protein
MTKWLGQSFADLAALKADLAIGDGKGMHGATGVTHIFSSGEYVTLGDGSKAHYDAAAAAWVAGAMP